MVHNLHMVVADQVDGKIKALYLGTDAAEANKVFEKASAENEAVRLIDFPQATRLRYPANEAEAASRRVTEAEAQAQRNFELKKASAKAARANAEKASEEAEKAAAEVKELEAKQANVEADPKKSKKEKTA